MPINYLTGTLHSRASQMVRYVFDCPENLENPRNNAANQTRGILAAHANPGFLQTAGSNDWPSRRPSLWSCQQVGKDDHERNPCRKCKQAPAEAVSGA